MNARAQKAKRKERGKEKEECHRKWNTTEGIFYNVCVGKQQVTGQVWMLFACFGKLVKVYQESWEPYPVHTIPRNANLDVSWPLEISNYTSYDIIE